jgi:hypothetical protein
MDLVQKKRVKCAVWVGVVYILKSTYPAYQRTPLIINKSEK